MQEVLKIEGSRCGRFSNALHASFHNRIFQLVNALDDKTKVNVSNELMSEYGNLIGKETELNRESRVSASTVTINEADAERDAAVSYILNVIKAASTAPIATVKTAGVALEALTRPYRGIQDAANDAETNLINGLLKDLRKPENNAHVTALNLSEAMTTLDAANRKFEEAKSKRTETRVANKKDKMTEVRSQTDAVYQRICDMVYASQLLCSVPDDKPVIEGLIKSINGVVAEFKTSYNQSQGQKKDEDDRPIMPDEGGESDRPVVV